MNFVHLASDMKKFWRILKKLLMVAGIMACAGLFITVLTSAIKKQNNLVCRNVQVSVDDITGITFLTPDDVKAIIHEQAGGNMIGKPLAGVDFRVLEKEIEKNPFVDNAEVYLDQQENINTTIVQRRPILRVINNDGVGYYLGEKNERIPLNDKFTPHVAVALGYVQMHQDTTRDSTVQAALYTLTEYIRKDAFLDALVDQVYVQENGELELIPKAGATIRFGQVDEQMMDKFDRLKIFCKEGLSKAGWEKYKAIDLRYNGQVVCDKKENTNTL